MSLLPKIHLITLAAFPHVSAESIHIAMFSRAMMKISDFTLVTPAKFWRPLTFFKSLKNYGMRGDEINQRKYMQFQKDGKGFIAKAIARAVSEHAIVYCRQMVVAEAAVKAGLKVVLELHTLPDTRDLHTLNDMLMLGSINLVVISSALKCDIKDLLECGNLSEYKIIVAPDAADGEKFYPGRRNGRSVSVGYIGSKYKGKGFEIILPLSRACPKVRFEVYGIERSELTEIESLSLPKNICLHGRVPYSRVPELMHTFDIALLPNQPSVILKGGVDIGRYTSPMKMFEYMASGKAIIASNLEIIKEVLVNNHNAILVAHDDIDEWKRAVDFLLENNDVMVGLGERARSDFMSKYTYDSRSAHIIHSLNLQSIISSRK